MRASRPKSSRSPRKPRLDAARVFYALGDPTRRAIVERLGNGPVSVSGLATPLEITVTAVAQHLRVLEDSGLVRTAKTGRVRTCHIETTGFSVLEQWIGDQRSLWERRFDRLGALLSEPDENA
ncbi:MAG: metalloregulator ArsR/SmtB family transcription factor [bacterium]